MRFEVRGWIRNVVRGLVVAAARKELNYFGALLATLPINKSRILPSDTAITRVRRVYFVRSSIFTKNPRESHWLHES